MKLKGCIVLLLLTLAFTAPLTQPSQAQEAEEKVPVYIQLVDVHRRPLQGFYVEAYNVTGVNETFVLVRETNSSGWVELPLAPGANYTFKIYWMDMVIKELAGVYVEKSVTLPPVVCGIANMRFFVADEEGTPLPDTPILLNYSYEDRFGRIANKTERLVTNASGMAELRGMPFLDYVVEGTRDGLAFQVLRVHLESDAEIRLVCPTRRLKVQVVDHYWRPLPGMLVEVRDSKTGRPLASAETASDGTVEFRLLVGRYDIAALNGTELINETSVKLVEDAELRIRYRLYDLAVRVVDCWGRPMPHVGVLVERGGVEVARLETNENGYAALSEIPRGDYKITVTVHGSPQAYVRVHLDRDLKEGVKLRRFIMLHGYAVEVPVLATLVALAASAALLLALTLLRRPPLGKT